MDDATPDEAEDYPTDTTPDHDVNMEEFLDTGVMAPALPEAHTQQVSSTGKLMDIINT